MNDAEGEATNREPEKCREIAWHPFDNLPEPMVDYVRHALTVLTDAFHTPSGWSRALSSLKMFMSKDDILTPLRWPLARACRSDHVQG